MMKGFLLLLGLSILHQSYGIIISECTGDLNLENATGLDYSFVKEDRFCSWSIVTTNNDVYAFFDILVLDEKDNLTITDKPIDTKALPIIALNKEVTITLTLSESQVFRRIKVSLRPNGTYSYHLDTHQASLLISQPLNLLSKNSTYDLKIITLNNDTVINALISNFDFSSGSVVLNNFTLEKENSGCELIDKTISLKVITKPGSTSKASFQLELVNKACSQTLRKLGEFGTNITQFDSNFPCRYSLLAMDQTNYIVVRLNSPKSFSSNSYLRIKDGANRTSNTLLTLDALTISEASGEYVLASHGCLYVESNYASFKIVLNGTKSAGTFNKPGPFTITPTEAGKFGFYLLQADQGLQVLANFPSTTSGTLKTYADTKSSVALYEINEPLTFPIISSTNKIVIIATDVKANITGKFEGVPKGCNQMGQTKDDLYTYNYIESSTCQPLCQFIVPPKTSSKDTLAIHIPTLQLNAAATISLFEIGAKTSFLTPRTPISEIYVEASNGFRLQVLKNCTAPSSNVSLNVLVDTLKGCSSIQTLNNGKSLSLTSPNYPSQYPLNAHCVTNITSDAKIALISLDDLDLAKGHHLFVNKVAYEGKLDFVTSSPISLEFNGEASLEDASTTARGYKLNITAADCGGSIDGPSEILKPTSTICIWTIKGVLSPSKKLIIKYEIYNLGKEEELTVVDGGYYKQNKTIPPKEGTGFSSAENLIVFYKGVNASTKFFFKYTAIPCNQSCDNGLCMQDVWKCNNVSECGDNSDELHCIPAPIPPETKTGWSNGSFTAAIILSLIVGCTVAFAAPLMYQRYRSASYRQFTADIN